MILGMTSVVIDVGYHDINNGQLILILKNVSIHS